MSSGFAINVNDFKQYCLETAQMYATLYLWYFMLARMHKVMIHKTQIIQWAHYQMGKCPKTF